MSRRRETIPPTYFDALYEAKPDPWDFRTSAYEHDKYQATMASLPRAGYMRGFEAGCSIGVLTRMLAEPCDRLLSCDASLAPLEQARKACADLTHVEFAHGAIPDFWPDGVFDLMVFSEVLYYLAPAELAVCAEKVSASLDRDGDVVMVHYTGETDYPLSGDAAASLFGAYIASFARETKSVRSERYRLDVWRRR